MANEQQKCQRCSNPAKYHVMKILNGKIYDYLLCGDHAQAISPTLKKHFASSQQVNIVSLIQHFLNQSQPGGQQDEANQGSGVVCPNCHLDYAQYRRTLLLGCSDCYDAFEDLLVKDLRKFHGAVSQSGEEPQIAGISGGITTAGIKGKTAKSQAKMEIPKEEQAGAISLLQLKKQLADAIQHEDFEKAAHLRDQIRDFETKQAQKEQHLQK